MNRFIVFYRLPDIFGGWIHLDMVATAKDENEAVKTIARRLSQDAEIYSVKSV